MFKRLCRYNKSEEALKKIKMLLFRKQSVPVRDERPYIVKILEIVRKWENLKIICLVGLIYAIGNIMYFGIEFTFQDQGYNYGINSIIIGSFEMFSFAYLRNL